MSKMNLTLMLTLSLFLPALSLADETAGGPPSKELTCSDNFCKGTFEELFNGLEVMEWGALYLSPRAVVRDALAVSSLGCTNPDFLWLRHGDNVEARQITSIEKSWVTLLLFAKSTGSEIKLIWSSSNKVAGECDIQKIRLN